MLHVHVDFSGLRRAEHVLGVRHRVEALQVDDLAEIVGELVSRSHVVDAVAELDDVARVEPRELHVEGSGRRVHRDRGIVRGPFTPLDGLVDLAVLSVDARSAELDALTLGLVSEDVLTVLSGGRLGERLEDDLAKLAGEAVLEHRRDGEVAQRAPVLALGRRVP